MQIVPLPVLSPGGQNMRGEDLDRICEGFTKLLALLDDSRRVARAGRLGRDRFDER